MDKKVFNFEFVVKGITRDQASFLRGYIESLVVEQLGGTMGGGFVELDPDEDNEEASNEQEVPE